MRRRFRISWNTAGFYTIDARIEEFANGLGLGDIGLDKDVSELSGGQRSKVLLTKLLLENPMILILDEPTNYLDENHIVWLTRFLQNYENAFILVSHDIPFLNDVVNVIYHVEEAVLTRYTSNYDDFMHMYDIKRAQLEQAYKKQQKSPIWRTLSPGIKRVSLLLIWRNPDRRNWTRWIKLNCQKEKPKPVFQFDYSRAPGKYVIEAENLVLGYDEALTNPLTFHVERGQKIAIKGVNGLGKSTLLKNHAGFHSGF